LILWCGGNELQGLKTGFKPVTLEHPMMKAFRDVVAAMDPDRRFIPSSPCGPSFSAMPEDFGRGCHWAVHGPWRAEGALEDNWMSYWERDDALFRSETGCPGASPKAIIEAGKGDCDPYPCDLRNPLWKRTSWWCEWDQYVAEEGGEPGSLEAYVEWSQARQARALSHAVRCCKKRFPSCGGIILWMGHDCFPCTANTSIVDFEGRPKPAALAVAEVFHQPTDGRSRAES
jgi:beta-mannosidase